MLVGKYICLHGNYAYMQAVLSENEHAAFFSHVLLFLCLSPHILLELIWDDNCKLTRRFFYWTHKNIKKEETRSFYTPSQTSCIVKYVFSLI